MLIVDALTAKTAKHTDPEDHPEQPANHLIAHDRSDDDDQNILGYVIPEDVRIALRSKRVALMAGIVIEGS